MMNARYYRHELKLPISLETLRSIEWTAFVGSKLERKPVPYSSPHNRYEATRTGLPSPGNEVVRLPKGDIGRKRRGCREGGPTKVRPRAELVCRKRRFPANALVTTISDIDHLELLLKRPRGSSSPGEKIRYRVTASSNQVPLPCSRRISYKYTCMQVNANGEVIGEKKERVGIALRGECGDVPYTRLGRSAEAHRNPGSGTLEAPVSLISAPRHPVTVRVGGGGHRVPFCPREPWFTGREIITRERRRAASYRKWPLLDPPRSTWEGPPPPSHHLHLRETETTEDERVAFYASKSDEETRDPTK
ncbi:hypothetical protein ALC53_12407 [Atta colombica]|uniref:Uncharacterized protein n=1 Tax=Atta colombica TaxID=520822 RepID=A0A195AYJ2_9HYME|nr:hypothetical protein ALC53_12407 [Atta colombica]